jgi:cell division protein FtsW
MKNGISKYLNGDRAIWLIILALSIISLLAVYSATGTLAYKYQHGDTTHYLFKHFKLLAMGFLVLFFTHRINYMYYKKLSLFLIIITVPLLFYTLVSGASLNQASRWLVLPGTGISFQTSDLAKFTLIIYIARHLASNQDNIKDFNTGFKPIIIWILAIVGLIFLANFSTAAMLFLISITLLFIGRVRVRYIASVIGIGVFFLLIGYFLVPHLPHWGRIHTWHARVERFIDGNNDENSEGNFQAEQSQIAIVKGGILGKGPGKSEQRNFLPHPYSDFIFAIIIEEYGLIGAIVIISLYLYLFLRIGVIIRKSTGAFASYLAAGIGLSLSIQAFINMGVAVGIFPVTGQTLPLVSMGGTSILFTSASLGILLSISRNADKQTKKNKKHE